MRSEDVLHDQIRMRGEFGEGCIGGRDELEAGGWRGVEGEGGRCSKGGKEIEEGVKGRRNNQAGYSFSGAHGRGGLV